MDTQIRNKEQEEARQLAEMSWEEKRWLGLRPSPDADGCSDAFKEKVRALDREKDFLFWECSDLLVRVHVDPITSQKTELFWPDSWMDDMAEEIEEDLFDELTEEFEEFEKSPAFMEVFCETLLKFVKELDLRSFDDYESRWLGSKELSKNLKESWFWGNLQGEFYGELTKNLKPLFLSLREL